MAGIFYPAHAQVLGGLIDRWGEKSAGHTSSVAVIAPHGGYETAGAVAAACYRRAGPHVGAVVVGPKHSRAGALCAVAAAGAWETPFGKVRVHDRLSTEILKESAGLLERDAAAHRYEHSAEVQLPFLQRCVGLEWFVPIVLSDAEEIDFQALGEGIARALRRLGEKVLLVGSVNLTRFESREEAKRKDSIAIRSLAALNAGGLIETARSGSISLCGLNAAAVVLSAALALGGSSAELVSYQTSGDVTGESESVVGYAGMTIA